MHCVKEFCIYVSVICWLLISSSDVNLLSEQNMGRSRRTTKINQDGATVGTTWTDIYLKLNIMKSELDYAKSIQNSFQKAMHITAYWQALSVISLEFVNAFINSSPENVFSESWHDLRLPRTGLEYRYNNNRRTLIFFSKWRPQLKKYLTPGWSNREVVIY